MIVDDLLLVFVSRVRVHLEAHIPLWAFSVSKKLRDNIERVQKICLFVILGPLATSDYLCNLAILDLEPLSFRRDKICKKFARKTFKHSTHRNMFSIIEGTNTRAKRKVRVPEARTARYRNSSIPQLAEIINEL